MSDPQTRKGPAVTTEAAAVPAPLRLPATIALDARPPAFVAFGTTDDAQCVRHRGFASDPVAAQRAMRRAEALARVRIGAPLDAGSRIEIRFDAGLVPEQPRLAIGAGDEAWPYWLDWIGPPLPVLGQPVTAGVPVRPKLTGNRGLIRIGALLRADPEIAARQRAGETLRYGQSIGWWPSAAAPRLQVSFGVWSDDALWPVVPGDDTVMAVLATLLAMASLRGRQSRQTTLLPRRLRRAS